jgi:ribosomal protein S18 acetylase RimI-like enzyme
LHPKWFAESALEEIANAARSEDGYVAVLEGMNVGFATYRIIGDRETAELTWIGIHPDFHRRGVGRGLMRAIEQDLRGRGIKELEVYTVAATVQYEPYALTRRFYHAIGFADVSIEPKGFPSGDDKLLLRKQL